MDKNEERTIIFKDREGHEIRKSDLKNITGTVRYEVIGTDKIPPQACQLHQQARVKGQQGQYAAVLEDLKQAHNLAPQWPYPLYDMAFTYLLQERYDLALKYYELVDELAPEGFFTSKTAIDTLQKERNGEYPTGLYLEYLRIDWTNDILKREEIARQILARIPDFAPAWKALANCIEDPVQRLEAIESGLNANPDRETEGTLLINKSIVIFEQGNKREAIDILGNLIFSPHSTIGVREFAKFVLSQFIERLTT
jgi:tetratricopeptide (TPR) repeat protein